MNKRVGIDIGSRAGGGAGGSLAPQTKSLGKELHHVLVRKTLLKMYLTIPGTKVTSERISSAFRQLKNYLRSAIKQDH